MRCIVTTEVDVERVAAGRIQDVPGLTPELQEGFSGLLIVDADVKDAAAELAKIPELNSIFPVDVETPAEIDAIVSVGEVLARDKIPRGKTFAVDTVRRGKHDFTSIDVNMALGGVITRDVSLAAPDYTVRVDIIRETAYLSVLPGKRGIEKPGGLAHRIAAKISIVQLFYPNESELTETMGHRIGRAAQAFGVKELVLAHSCETEAEDFARFCQGACKGRETRLKKVQRIRGERTREVPIKVADLFQIVRHKRNEPIIIASAFGEAVSACYPRVADLFSSAPNVHLLIGARRGIPKGLFRFADVIVNLAPGMTFATEHGIPSAVTGLIACVQFDDCTEGGTCAHQHGTEG